MRAELSAFLERRGLSTVVAVAAVGVTFRLWIAASTFGTDDVRYWIHFADGVRRFGPIGIYGHHFESLYNHPPLAGWMLLAVNHLQALGLSVPFLVRVPASLADGGTAVVLFLLLDRRGDRLRAVASSLLFLLSPLGIIISGFHGNTDPVFMMLALSALYQSRVKQRHLTAGVLLALAISVKIVPIVLLPVFLLLLARAGRRAVVRFTGGGAAVFLVLWLPVLVDRPAPFISDVLGYAGNGLIQWGLPAMAEVAGVDAGAHSTVLRAASYAALALSALVPVLVARKCARLDPLRFGLAMAMFLLLSPAFGMQYLVWPLAACYLVSLRYATLYNAAASLFALVVYSRWNHAYPWGWSEARSTLLPAFLLPLMIVAWLALLFVVLRGIDGLSRGRVAAEASGAPQPRVSTVRPVP